VVRGEKPLRLSPLQQLEIFAPTDAENSQIVADNEYGQIAFHGDNQRAFQVVAFVDAVVAFLPLKPAAGF